MTISKEQKESYVSNVYEALRLHGVLQDDIPHVISKTGFMQALEEYPLL